MVRTSKPETLTIVGGLILALQGVFTETFEFPTTVVGWVRFVLMLAGLIVLVFTRSLAPISRPPEEA